MTGISTEGDEVGEVSVDEPLGAAMRDSDSALLWRQKRMMACLSHIGLLVWPILGPAVIRSLAGGRENEFVYRHATSAISYQAIAFPIVLVLEALAFRGPSGFTVVFVVAVLGSGWLALTAARQAWKGKDWSYRRSPPS